MLLNHFTLKTVEVMSILNGLKKWLNKANMLMLKENPLGDFHRRKSQENERLFKANWQRLEADLINEERSRNIQE